jgi:hypothetical protein
MISKSAITELKELLKKASAICEDNAHLADNIDLIGMSDQLDEYVDDLDKIKEFEVYDEDDEPEYDSAGFTYEDRVVDGQYRVIDFDMEAQNYDVFGNNKI